MKTKTTRLVNRRRAGYDVFVGRPGPWGNPFREGCDGTRAEVIKKYEIWLRQQLKRPAFAAAFDALQGKILGCYCVPKPCHGHVMVQLLEERRAGIYNAADCPACETSACGRCLPHAKGESPFTAWPADQPPRYNACTNACDMWSGPCACGAWHTEGK